MKTSRTARHPSVIGGAGPDRSAGLDTPPPRWSSSARRNSLAEHQDVEPLAGFEDCALFTGVLDGTASPRYLAGSDLARYPVTIAWAHHRRLLLFP
jgi:hypothetical protein